LYSTVLWCSREAVAIIVVVSEQLGCRVSEQLGWRVSEQQPVRVCVRDDDSYG
jgi:hypothetical protein